MARAATVSLLLVLLFVILVPVLIGVYVWRDARGRGMNAVLWTLIAVLAPTFIGLIIYLIVRGSYSNLRCPVCAGRVTEQYVVCPNCGTKLRATCPNCGMAAEPEWKVCPHCARTLPTENADVRSPVQKKDRALGKILLAVILVPILLIVLSLVTFTSTGYAGSVAVSQVAVEEYLAECDEVDIREWIQVCSELDGKRAYVLQNQVQQGDEYVTGYLVYLPFARECNSETNKQQTLFEHILQLEVIDHGDGTSHGMIWEIQETNSEGFSSIEVVYNGEELECEVHGIDELSVIIAE